MLKMVNNISNTYDTLSLKLLIYGMSNRLQHIKHFKICNTVRKLYVVHPILVDIRTHSYF